MLNVVVPQHQAVKMFPHMNKLKLTGQNLGRGARYLTGENLKVVWAEFSTLSLAV
jgi:hypothetical protein